VIPKLQGQQHNISHVVIPGGCTSKVQPLDVSLNKPLKAYLRGSWEEYLIAATRAGTWNIPTAHNQGGNPEVDNIRK
jgi:hypothetical protein